MEEFLKDYMHYHIGVNLILFTMTIIFTIDMKINIIKHDEIKKKIFTAFSYIIGIILFLYFIQLDLFQWTKLHIYGLLYYFLFSIIISLILFLEYMRNKK